MQYEHTAGIDTSLGIDGVDRGKQLMFGSSKSRREPGRWSTDGGKGGGSSLLSTIYTFWVRLY